MHQYCTTPLRKMVLCLQCIKSVESCTSYPKVCYIWVCKHVNLSVSENLHKLSSFLIYTVTICVSCMLPFNISGLNTHNHVTIISKVSLINRNVHRQTYNTVLVGAKKTSIMDPRKPYIMYLFLLLLSSSPLGLSFYWERSSGQLRHLHGLPSHAFLCMKLCVCAT